MVSTVMVKEKRDEHKPIYYMSKVLQGVETKYFTIEKFAYAMVIIVRKMKPYF